MPVPRGQRHGCRCRRQVAKPHDTADKHEEGSFVGTSQSAASAATTKISNATPSEPMIGPSQGRNLVTTYLSPQSRA
jgi:hypothetical protein